MKKGTLLGYKYCRNWELLWQAEHLFITFSTVLFSVAHDEESELPAVQTMLSCKHNTLLFRYLKYYKVSTLLQGSDSQKSGDKKDSSKTGHLLWRKYLTYRWGDLFRVNINTLGNVRANLEKTSCGKAICIRVLHKIPTIILTLWHSCQGMRFW